MSPSFFFLLSRLSSSLPHTHTCTRMHTHTHTAPSSSNHPHCNHTSLFLSGSLHLPLAGSNRDVHLLDLPPLLPEERAGHQRRHGGELRLCHLLPGSHTVSRSTCVSGDVLHYQPCSQDFLSLVPRPSHKEKWCGEPSRISWSSVRFCISVNVQSVLYQTRSRKVWILK